MITIEFSFAWLFFIMMVIGFICIVAGTITFKPEVVVIGVVLVFVGDFACILGSANYMSHPTNGYEVSSYLNKCAEFNYTTNNFNEPTQCIMPTPQDNPYEKQPLHPIAWILGFIADMGRLTTGAVKFKVM